MAEEWILENAHLRMCVSSLGGKVQSLFSRQYQAPVLYENPAGGMFPMLPLANRVAGNRFIFHGQEIVLPRHHADEYFFLHGDGWLQRWDIIECGAEYCVLQLRRQHACGFDYLAQLRYQLLRNQLIAELTLTHYGEVLRFTAAAFIPFSLSMNAARFSSVSAVTGRKGRIIYLSTGKETCPTMPISAWLSSVKIVG